MNIKEVFFLKVTEKEKNRAIKTKEQIQELHKKGYKVKDVTVSMSKANIMGILFGFMLSLPICLAYYLKFGYLFIEPEPNVVEQIIVGILFLASFVVHEGIHGLCMYLFNGKKTSLIEFGFINGNPYCTCQSPINKTKYIIFALMPTLVLEIIFTIAAFRFGTVWWLALVIGNAFGCGGDFTNIWKILRLRYKNMKIVDHPYKCGFFALSKEFQDDEYENITTEIDSLTTT